MSSQDTFIVSLDKISPTFSVAVVSLHLNPLKGIHILTRQALSLFKGSFRRTSDDDSK
jgi:hypothetical protein